MKEGVGKKSPYGVTGMPPTGDFADDMEHVGGDMEQIPEHDSGMQHGQHSMKSQPKIMRYI